MDLNNNQTTTTITSRSSTYCGLYEQPVSWVVGDSAFHMILGVLTVVASFPTALLNALIILAIKQRRELQKPSNILLSSLAVTDLLVGAISMPTTATIDFFRIRRVSFEKTCMLGLVNAIFMPLLFIATLNHLTIIAWERYVAVQKWRNYKRIITNGRLKKIAIFTWLSALFPTAVYYFLRVFLLERKIFDIVFACWTAVESVCLFLVAFFYLKVYLGIRNRNLNDTSQIHVLMRAKLESKIAKTTGLLTAALISSFIPICLLAILRNVVPLLRTNAAIRFTQLVTQLNSLFNPLLYCYREHRFRNAIRELLGLKKGEAIQVEVGAPQLTRRNDSIRPSELHKEGKHTKRLTRSASCNLTDALYSIHGTPRVVMLKKSLSAPTLDTCSSSLDGLDLQQPSSIVECKARKNNPEASVDVLNQA